MNNKDFKATGVNTFLTRRIENKGLEILEFI